ncbi:MAG: hypothetical protein A2660_00330 [Candidatus Doudnabacteria bacterium RIFCSPHIGHO2_01_FULL_45_18]|uniref:Uncharacterized protein n=1 Tax=Candidatus Doudnabacteria bacterium RIFCSPHIGHO2_01_FULL_45_18 TaxID=1817823 RepID=A0A1F5NR48_9BACT|nr:MAG: hypothetical protein A2660_00330 [Candidatus Doudnabacteria bacterium RIFCSPHIGHO2_01_FULL_45_18]
MFNRISSTTLGLLMLVLLLGSTAGNTSNYYVLGWSIAVLILASLVINFKRLNFTWPHLLLPIIYLISSGSIFAIITDSTWRLVFLIVASVVFGILEMKLGRESHFLQNVYLLSVFGLYLALFAVEFYFDLQIWWFVLAVFALTYFLAIQGFAGFDLPAKKYFYLLLAMICAEAAWGLSFWPIYFLAAAVILFCFYYVLWLFAFSAFFGRLTRQKVYWQLALVTIVLFLTLSTAAWKPLT